MNARHWQEGRGAVGVWALLRGIWSVEGEREVGGGGVKNEGCRRLPKPRTPEEHTYSIIVQMIQRFILGGRTN